MKKICALFFALVSLASHAQRNTSIYPGPEGQTIRQTEKGDVCLRIKDHAEPALSYIEFFVLDPFEGSSANGFKYFTIDFKDAAKGVPRLGDIHTLQPFLLITPDDAGKGYRQMGEAGKADLYFYIGSNIREDVLVPNDTTAGFDFEHPLKLDYNGTEDEIIQKIEEGNPSIPVQPVSDEYFLISPFTPAIVPKP